MSKSLALTYRPKSWSDVVEQDSVKSILQNQLDTGDIKQAYLFVGAAGTGKTTCARIFANEINHFSGLPIELDAASNNSVDDVRNLNKMAQTRSVDGEYKVFILDEVHMFSAGAWAAMLKLIEEPPAKTIFILCTTDYWKIPKTILSRCQRYDFQRISVTGIKARLEAIIAAEGENTAIKYDDEALDFIARQSDGCLRDAITNLDKCIAYGELTLHNVLEALRASSIEEYIDLTDCIAHIANRQEDVITLLDKVYNSGRDMKQFIKGYIDFVLDINKIHITNSFTFTHLPETEELAEWIKSIYKDTEVGFMLYLLENLIRLDSDIKWSQNPKTVIEARLLTL